MASSNKALIKKLKKLNPDVKSARKKTLTKNNYTNPASKNNKPVVTGDNSSIKQIKYNYIDGDLCKIRKSFFNKENIIKAGEIAIIVSTSTYQVLEKGKVIERKVTKDKILIFIDYSLIEIDGSFIQKI